MGRLDAIKEFWSDQGSHFDGEPDHGLADPVVRHAWAGFLADWVPAKAVKVVDLGCGTGSVSALLAHCGHDVVGIDLSPAMVTLAQAKAEREGWAARFCVGDASDPDLPDGEFDVVLARHAVWTLLDPIGALHRWARLLKPDGRFVLIEGRWAHSPGGYEPTSGLPWEGGVTAADLMCVLLPMFGQIHHYPLTAETALWGKAVNDERFAIVAKNPSTHH